MGNIFDRLWGEKILMKQRHDNRKIIRFIHNFFYIKLCVFFLVLRLFVFDQIEFWNYVKSHQNSITYINFQT